LAGYFAPALAAELLGSCAAANFPCPVSDLAPFFFRANLCRLLAAQAAKRYGVWVLPLHDRKYTIINA
jgi:hypothetical protein